LSCRGNQRFQTTEIRAISDPELVLALPFDDTAVAVDDQALSSFFPWGIGLVFRMSSIATAVLVVIQPANEDFIRIFG
jgi:hypothetical protein